MKTNDLSQYERIQRVGKILWGFSWFWLIFNMLALAIVVAVVVGLGMMDAAGSGEKVTRLFTHGNLIPGVDSAVMNEIVKWDYQNYLDHFWMTLFYTIGALLYFIATMVLILKIAAAWKKGDIFGDSPIQCFRLLGWIYLIHGVTSQIWGVAGQFWGNTHTFELVYFSFIRDVCFMSFTISGSGIEWGLLALTLSWILKLAREMRDEQQLTV